ncbi:MAG: DoxX family protein [Candidatus Hodarchaeales archaeon]
MTREIIKSMHEQKISGGYLVLLRLTLGFAFLTTWISNLVKGAFTGQGYKDTIDFFLSNSDHIATPFDTLIEMTFPYATLFGLGWMVIELFISVSLIFGVVTRLGGFVGVGSTVVLGLGSLGVEWIWTHPLLFIGFLTCALVGAGRWYGVDYWLKDRYSGTIVKYLI